MRLTHTARGFMATLMVVALGCTSPSDPRRLERAEESLRLRVPAIFEDKPLAEVLVELQRFGGPDLDFHIRWNVLAKAGVRKDKPVYAQLRDIDLAKALGLILADVGGKEAGVIYTVRDDGTILISTRADIMTNATVTRAYDLADLLTPALDSRQSAEQIGTLIKQSVAPGSWSSGPGDPGGLADVRGSTIVIRQTEENHRYVKALLRKMHS